MKKQKCPHCTAVIPLGSEAKHAHFMYQHDFTLEDPEWINIDNEWVVLDL